MLLEKIQVCAEPQPSNHPKSNVLLTQSNVVLVENLPERYQHTKLMEELLKNYPGVERIVN